LEARADLPRRCVDFVGDEDAADRDATRTSRIAMPRSSPFRRRSLSLLLRRCACASPRTRVSEALRAVASVLERLTSTDRSGLGGVGEAGTSARRWRNVAVPACRTYTV